MRTFEELGTLWLKVKETELAASTLRKTGFQIATLKFIVNSDTPIASIRHIDILNYGNELLCGETNYSNAKRGNKIGRTVHTIENYISLLCTLLRFAHRS